MMTQSPQDDVLIRLKASPLRRYSALVLLAVFAMVVVQVAIELPSDRMVQRGILWLCGLGLIWQGVRVWRASAYELQLTPEGLRYSRDGRYLARIDEIEDVNTSIFAFRPATGFLVILKDPAQARSAPGMFWTAGRRIGIGGVTAKYEAKAMAEMLREMTRAKMFDTLGPKS